MCIHDLTGEDFAKMTQDELMEHHIDFTCQIADASRAIANAQRHIYVVTDLIEELELELEAREVGDKNQMN